MPLLLINIGTRNFFGKRSNPEGVLKYKGFQILKDSRKISLCYYKSSSPTVNQERHHFHQEKNHADIVDNKE